MRWREPLYRFSRNCENSLSSRRIFIYLAQYLRIIFQLLAACKIISIGLYRTKYRTIEYLLRNWFVADKYPLSALYSRAVACFNFATKKNDSRKRYMLTPVSASFPPDATIPACEPSLMLANTGTPVPGLLYSSVQRRKNARKRSENDGVGWGEGAGGDESKVTNRNVLLAGNEFLRYLL